MFGNILFSNSKNLIKQKTEMISREYHYQTSQPSSDTGLIKGTKVKFNAETIVKNRS